MTIDHDQDLDDWAAIENAWHERVEARTLFDCAKLTHEHAMNEMMRAERAVEAARQRAEASIKHGERAGQMLIDAIKLMERRGPR